MRRLPRSGPTPVLIKGRYENKADLPGPINPEEKARLYQGIFPLIQNDVEFQATHIHVHPGAGTVQIEVKVHPIESAQATPSEAGGIAVFDRKSEKMSRGIGLATQRSAVV